MPACALTEEKKLTYRYKCYPILGFFPQYHHEVANKICKNKIPGNTSNKRKKTLTKKNQIFKPREFFFKHKFVVCVAQTGIFESGFKSNLLQVRIKITK